MKKVILYSLIAAVFGGANAQTYTQGFEGVTLDSGKVLNGKAGEKEYHFTDQGDLRMPTFWDTSFGGYWASGWAISRKYDSVTTASNYSTQLYCVKPFKGSAQSNTFAIGQNNTYLKSASDQNDYVVGLKITNTTFAYNSMRFGDMYGKKFGGSTGKDSDYLFVRIQFFSPALPSDSIDIYLADFRSADSTKDYILDTWQSVNLPYVDSVTFTMYSSDNSAWGMNTPGFFAVDDVRIDHVLNVRGISKRNVKAWPNPANSGIHFEANGPVERIRVYNGLGSIVAELDNGGDNQVYLNCTTLRSGIYFAEFVSAHSTSRKQFIVSH
jgi:hypothetical protein